MQEEENNILLLKIDFVHKKYNNLNNKKNLKKL